MFFRFLLVISALGICAYIIASDQEGDVLKQLEKACAYCSSCVKKMDVEIEVQGFKKR